MRRCLLDGASRLPAEGRELRVSLQKQSGPRVVQDCSGLRGMAGLTAVPGKAGASTGGPAEARKHTKASWLLLARHDSWSVWPQEPVQLWPGMTRGLSGLRSLGSQGGG